MELSPDARKAAYFIEHFCRQSKGEWAGEPIKLEPWQLDILDGLLARDKSGNRPVKTGLIGVPRKNGKSTLASALALYGLIADGEPGTEVYSAAGDKKQARLVFDEAAKMLKASPELAELRPEIYEGQSAVIRIPGTNSVYRALSADADLQQGLNPNLVIFDEVHVQPNSKLWTALTLGSGTRRNPLTLGITTAGFDRDSLLGQLYQYGKRLERGEIADPSFYFKWYEPEPGFDWQDESCWYKANPMLGISLKIEALRAALPPKTPIGEFLRYHLNAWTEAESPWLPPGAWDLCRGEVEFNPALPVYVGIDVAKRYDSSAIAMAQPQGDSIALRARVWGNPYQPSDQRYHGWTMDLAILENHCREIAEAFPVKATDTEYAGPAFLYDPMFFERSAQILEGDQLAMIEWPQTDARMIPATGSFYSAITNRQIAHDGDPVLAAHIGAVWGQEKPRGQRISKRGTTKKIDAAVASAIAIHAALVLIPGDGSGSVYEDRGLISL